MPAYIGNKKVKELYYGGKKIKEAWYGSKKVFSSGPPVWELGKKYNLGDVVQLDGVMYECVYSHQSTEYYRPGTGAHAAVVWSLGTNLGGDGGSTPTQPSQPSASAWENGTLYKVGSLVTSTFRETAVYRCLAEHTSDTASDMPGYGSLWRVYWEKVS